MNKLRSPALLDGSKDDLVTASASIPSPAKEPAAEFLVAGHERLFQSAEQAGCDACGAPMAPANSGGSSESLDGSGFYLRARGGEVSLERTPICSSCASVIGMTALARWEIEEEEG